MRRAFWALALVGAGCAAAPTSLLIRVQAASGLALTSLTATVALGGQSAATSSSRTGRIVLPGTLVVLLNDVAVDVDVELGAVDVGGAAWSASGTVTSVPHEQVVRTLVLGPGALPDGGAPDLGDGAAPADGGAPADGAVDLGDGAAPADARPQDAACPAAALFCEDFESGGFGQWTSQTSTGGNSSLAVDSVQPHRGVYALHGKVTGTNTYGTNYWLKNLPLVTSGSLDIRAFVRPPGDLGHYLALFGLQDSGGTHGYAVEPANLLGQSNTLQIISVGAAPSQTTNLQLPSGVWTCIELAVDIAAQPSGQAMVHLFVNDSEVLTFSDMTNTNGTGYSVALGGMVEYAGDLTTQIFLDDLVVSPTHIGCQ